MGSTSGLSIPEMTGGLLVMFEPGKKAREIDDLVRNRVGARTVHTRDFKHANAAVIEALDAEQAVSLDNLGIAVVPARENDVSGASFANVPGLVAVRPEFWMHAVDDWSSRLKAWLSQGQALLEEQARTQEDPSTLVGPLPSAISSVADATWGSPRRERTRRGIRAPAFVSPFSIPGSIAITAISSGARSSAKASSPTRRSMTGRATEPIALERLAGRGAQARRSATALPTVHRSTWARCSTTAGRAGKAGYWPASTGPSAADAKSSRCRSGAPSNPTNRRIPSMKGPARTPWTTDR